MLIKEIATIKPLTPEKARINALKTQKDNANKALKAERDRQKIAKAQKTSIQHCTHSSITTKAKFA